jgi:rhodanese-related sulfurtransferase
MSRRKLVRFVLPLVLALACTAGAEPGSITPEQLLAAEKGSGAPLVLDVRSAEEFASGRVPGARNVPYDEVAHRLDELGPPGEVVVYCERGGRAAKAAAALGAAGFSVKHLTGDMSGWRAQGLPIER